jgi:hypothetical protein
MRNNNQVTPKRSYSPRLIPNDNQYSGTGIGQRNIMLPQQQPQQVQYFPSPNNLNNK